MERAPSWGLFAAVLLAAAEPAAAQERVRVTTSAELRAAVGSAGPGCVIALAPGTYAPGVRLAGVTGAEGRPVVVEAEDPDRPPVFRGGACALHLVDCRPVTLRHLVVEGCSGNGVNVDDGGSIDSPSHHVVLEDVAVLGIGPTGNRDGTRTMRALSTDPRLAGVGAPSPD